MSSVSWYFFMSPCMLSLHLFLGRPRFLLPETSSRSDFAQNLVWLGSRLKQWPNHFIVFCFPGKFQQVLRGPSSWCLHFWCGPTWSSLFSLAHLDILISAEFSFLSSFFFTAQHYEPYVIAGLMIVLNCWSSAHDSQTQLSMFPGLPPLSHES